ncbi:AAA family ATPase [Ruegeria lacuscaerulensis]|uniref:AAA family ATPase n=1 Tax=Ruegeria lacuscaerulensis TaxID=55218 RepID=UPI00147E2934|nr:AAA family ATPase [Ruegeria lacuscaerulensis]
MTDANSKEDDNELTWRNASNELWRAADTKLRDHCLGSNDPDVVVAGGEAYVMHSGIEFPFRKLNGRWTDLKEVEEQAQRPTEIASDRAFGLDLTPDWVNRMKQYETPTDFVVFPFFPRGVISSFYARGGTGKSYYLLSVATRLALGRPAMGHLPKEPIKVLFLTGEDPMREVVHRLRTILRGIGADEEDMGILEENLLMPDLMTENMGMTSFTPDGHMVLSQFGRKVENAIQQAAPDLVILDPLSDIYQEDENNRAKVARFMTELTGTANRQDCAIVLVAHPSKATESQYSGSTAWDSKTRSRLWMSHTDGFLMIEHAKSQYAETAEDIVLTWEGGYPTEAMEEDMQAMQAMRMAETMNQICGVIRTYQGSERPCTTQPRADDGIYRRAARYSQNEIDLALAELIKSGKVEKRYLDGKEGRPKKRSGSGGFVHGLFLKSGEPR